MLSNENIRLRKLLAMAGKLMLADSKVEERQKLLSEINALNHKP